MRKYLRRNGGGSLSKRAAGFIFPLPAHFLAAAGCRWFLFVGMDLVPDRPIRVAVVVTPIAVILFKKLVSHLVLKSPLATLILPALLPVALSLGMAVAAFSPDLTLVPLTLVTVWHPTGQRSAGYLTRRSSRCMRLSASYLRQRSGFSCLMPGLR